MKDIITPPFTEEQKKLITFTEKLANGNQICDVDGVDITTNFERITKSPAALAEWLNEHSDYCKEIQNWQCADCPYSDKYCTRENQWLDWLMKESDTE